MWQRIASLLGIGLLTLIHVTNNADPWYLFFVYPFVLLLIFYLYLKGDKIFTALTAVFTLFLAIYAIEQTRSLEHLFLVLAGGVCFLGLRAYR